MKVVDVLSTKVYSDSQQIIAQVMNLFVWSVLELAFLYHASVEHVWTLRHAFCVYLQLH